ncbi:MAG: cell division protein FtsI (penicillin-binding protein 3) [Candidatus Tokpelaia sp. JSC161]|jgi:cell division protein FtsI (penicillin-binding protein 3)|nr:MAG: cell division protein FtsI (penicillin-binding protein 3) [Candidatus Tokpelaia sp. JSC161]
MKSFLRFDDVKKAFYLKRYRLRFLVSVFSFLFLYLGICTRLIQYGRENFKMKVEKSFSETYRGRPDIVDRHGRLLATDVKTYSLFAEPRRIIDVNETIELLSRVLRDLRLDEVWRKLKSNSGFVWIKRGLTPDQKARIMELGIPGLGFRVETRRFYPDGSIASHILGFVDVDNKGLSGIEKYIDQSGLSDLRAVWRAPALKQLVLSIDIRIQALVHEELKKAIKRYRAQAGGALLLNVKTGEVIALVSLPDFDPNNPLKALQPNRLNRMTAGLFEMGSTIKSFTTAMALDSGVFQLDTKIDASKPLHFGHQMIRDFHGKYRALALWEVFIYSSNIGSAKEAEILGIQHHRAFIKRIGLLERIGIELPEIASPIEPHVWKKVNSMTIAFGHGMMTTPLQTAVAAAALMNGGRLIEPTFLFKKNHNFLHGTQVIKPKTSSDLRYLYELNAKMGSARNTVVDGYRVGGKTGTAEKVVKGRYVKDRRFNTFLAAFPMDDPSYVVLTIIDEPKPEKGRVSATSALNAAPLAAEIIRRSALFLGIHPDFTKEDAKTLIDPRYK